MKKLMLILGAVGLTATTSAIVVSCSNSIERWDKIKFSDKNIYKTLILKMKNEGLITKSQADVFYGISETEQIEDVIKLINKSITDLEYKQTISNQSSTFNLKEVAYSSSDDILDNLSSTIVYNDYTNKMIVNNGDSIGDQTFGKRVLNPSNLIKGDDNYKYAIYFNDPSEGNKWLRWEYAHEFDRNNGTVQTPSLSLLTNNDNKNNKNFKILGYQKETKIDHKENLPKTTIGLGGEISETTPTKFLVEEPFSGFEIMKYRFQNYISDSIKTDLYNQLIGMAYLNDSIVSTSWTSKNYTNTNSRLNTTNKLVSSFQNRLTEGQESNIKMVWSIRNKAKSSAIESWVTSIKQQFDNTTVNGNIKISDGSLQTLIDLANGKGESQLANTVEEGYDNFFGMKGYNGIVRNTESSVEAITSQELKISDDAKTAAKAINSPTILTNNGLGFSVEDGKATELVFVLPLYLNDIYSYHDINVTQENNINQITIPVNTWVSMSDKVVNYEVVKTIEYPKGNVIVATDNSKNLYLKASESTSEASVKINNTEVKINVLEDSRTLGVNGETNRSDNAFTSKFDTTEQAKFSDGDKIIYQNNFTRTIDPLRNYQQMISWEISDKQSIDVRNLSATAKQTLLDQISNGLVSKDSEYVEEAKTVLYTKYIMDGDKILSQGLYDQISKYIKDDEDESSD